MSNYKLTFKLRQHTPIIHFQHDQHGATLRATEVKPKLDRFIMEKCRAEGIDYEQWLIGDGEKPALDFKIRITAKNIETIEIEEGKRFRAPNYFANMGSDYKSTALSFTPDDIDLTISVFDKNLQEQIVKRMNEFFLINNFGTRQTKGFGSYSLIEVDNIEPYFDAYITLNNPNRNASLWSYNNELYSGIWEEHISVLGNIELFYKSLRSGINRKDRSDNTIFYIKPAIFYYAKDVLKKQWDKKSIKEHYLLGVLENQIEQHDDADVLTFSDTDALHILVKDVFGLSSLEVWRSYSRNVKKTHSTVDRFRSPLLFKPIKIQDNKYFIGVKCTPVDEGFLNKEFDIEFGNSNGLKLKTPDQFSWGSFWDYFFNKMPSLAERCSSDRNLNGTDEYRTLQNIYNSIQRSR